EPDLDALIDAMRRAACDQSANRTKGSAAAEWIRTRFTWSHSADAVEQRLHALVAAEPTKPSGAAAMSTAIEAPKALVSVILTCGDELALTRQCVVALMRHTRAPWELIVVDNGSTDGTATYLAGVQDASTTPVTVITNPVRQSSSAAANQALSIAQ